jgi:hypothetical protein
MGELMQWFNSEKNNPNIHPSVLETSEISCTYSELIHAFKTPQYKTVFGLILG